jgi:hypothetical protein
MNSFTVVSAVYDGTAPGYPNPMVLISGTVNGKNVFPRVFFRYLDAANAAGGSGMQSALSAILFNQFAGLYGYTLKPWPAPIPYPTFPPSNAIAQYTQGPYPVAPVIYSPALIAPWLA